MSDEGGTVGAPDPPPPPADLAGDDLERDFVDLYRSTYPRLVRALVLGGSPPASAEDLAQEAFARTLVHWWRVRRGTNPTGYLYRVAFRLARRAGPNLANAFPDPPGADPSDGIVTGIEVERVLAAMPPARRRCAVLCFVVGLSTKEAARSLLIAESTVRKQLEHARRDLRAAGVAG